MPHEVEVLFAHIALQDIHGSRRAEVEEYLTHTEREDGSHANVYLVVSGEQEERYVRCYVADDPAHANEQHKDAFPEEGDPYVVLEVTA